MLSKFVIPGNKVELQSVERTKLMNESANKRVYKTIVYDVLSDDRLEIAMPLEKSKLILLPVDAEFDLYFYTGNGLYQCFAKIIDRYKRDGQYLLLAELTSNLRKFQRREYYRLSCVLEMNARALEEEEIKLVENNVEYLVPGLPLKRSIIVDISGGGIRFIGDYAYNEGSLICCKYHLQIEGKDKEYTLISKIINVKPMEERPGMYEHRAQYIKIDTLDREEIIRFIFEEERRNRKREKDFK